MWRRFFWVLAVVLVGVPCVMPRAASALTAQPAVIDDIVLDPGETYVGSIRLHNETSSAETFSLHVKDFIASDEVGTPMFIDDAGARSMKDWISFSRPSLRIDAGDGELLMYTIRVPRSAAPGGYYAGVQFSSGSDVDAASYPVSGPLLLVRVTGHVVEKGDVSSFITHQASQTSLPVEFSVRFQNDGNTHVKPKGFVSITNMFGGVSAIIPVNEGGGNVLSESSRVFTFRWNKADLPENASELSKEWNDFGFGPYTATLVLHYGEQRQITSATTSFFVFPWMLVVLSCILVAVLALLLMQYNRWVISRAISARRK